MSWVVSENCPTSADYREFELCYPTETGWQKKHLRLYENGKITIGDKYSEFTAEFTTEIKRCGR